LLKLLEQTGSGSVLVFTRTKHRAKRLGEKLGKSGYRTASLQGNLSQPRRQAALDGFRDGSFQILVATDIAARGIDVSQVSHVINFDMPNTSDAYIHRIGRTGRAARTGDAFTMVAPEDGLMVRTIERVLGTQLEQRRLEGFDYSAPAPERPAQAARRPDRSARYAKPQGNKSKPASGSRKPSRGQRRSGQR